MYIYIVISDVPNWPSNNDVAFFFFFSVAEGYPLKRVCGLWICMYCMYKLEAGLGRGVRT